MASRGTKKKKEVAPPSQETVEKKKMASSEETADDIANQESQVDDGANKEGAKVVSSERKSSENPESAETQVTAGMAFQETDQKKASVKGKGKIDDQESAGDNKVDEEVVSSERRSEEAEEQKKKMASKSEETTTAVADDEKTRELINMLGVKLEIKDDGDDHDDDDGEKTALIKEKAVPSERKSPENQESAVTTETGSDQETEKQKKIHGEKKASAKGKGKIDDQESAGINKEASSERKSSPPPPEERRESVLLFETKLKALDVHPNIQRLVFGDCADMLKWTYFKLVKEEINYYLKIMTEDPNGAEYELHFMPYFTTRYTFYNEWHKIVAANGLQEGDTVAGWGKIVAGKFKMTLTITKEGEVEKKTETETETLKEEESEKVVSSERKSSSAVPPTPPVFLFEKVLEAFAVSAKRVMVSRCSQVVERAMEREEERNPKKAYRYVRVMAKDPRGAEHELHLTRDAVSGSYHLGHQWRKLVDDNRLKVGDRVEGWGNEFGDGLKVSLHIFRIRD